MKKNIRCSKLIIATILLGLTTSFSALATDAEIVNAIDKMSDNITNVLKGSSDTSVVDQLVANGKQTTTLFDNVFKGIFSGGELEKIGPLDEKIGLYVKNFYAWFTTESFESLDFSDTIKKNQEAIENLQAQVISYNYDKSLLGKLSDQKALLAQPVESRSNNFNKTVLGVSKNSSPYGSLDYDSSKQEGAPTIADLLGPDSYSTEDANNKAKLFINYIMDSVPAPKNIRIPEKTEAIKNKVTIYLPYSDGDDPYTTVTISTKPTLSRSGGFIPTSGNSDYDKMKSFIEQDYRFQTVKQKMRANNTLRTLYLEALIQAYQDRAIDLDKKDDEESSENNKSLAEKEKALALEGLDKEYYDKLKTKSTADINLETLKAIKTLTYYMWKLHKDNELNALMIGASGLRLATSDLQDESLYIKPVGTLIKNRCWDIDKNSSEERKQACKNPVAAQAAALPGA